MLYKQAVELKQQTGALARLRAWQLPFRTPGDFGYYTAAQIRDLQELASRYRLAGSDWFAKMPTDILRGVLNGITDNRHPWLRALATFVNPEFQVAAAIHDVEFDNADGSSDRALEANERMKQNLQVLSDKTSSGPLASWWNRNIHANIYKFILDRKYHDNLQAAWERKQQAAEAAAKQQAGHAPAASGQ